MPILNPDYEDLVDVYEEHATFDFGKTFVIDAVVQWVAEQIKEMGFNIVPTAQAPAFELMQGKELEWFDIVSNVEIKHAKEKQTIGWNGDLLVVSQKHGDTHLTYMVYANNKRRHEGFMHCDLLTLAVTHNAEIQEDQIEKIEKIIRENLIRYNHQVEA